MAEYGYFHIDAFAERPMMGNQAAVMPMDSFLPDAQLQAIAAENNFAETAYIVKTGDDSWDLRWFTPAMEVPLCGHATLASAHAIFNHLGFEGDAINFDTRQSGRLVVRKLDDGRLEMDFPADMPKRIEIPRYLPRLSVQIQMNSGRARSCSPCSMIRMSCGTSIQISMPSCRSPRTPRAMPAI